MVSTWLVVNIGTDLPYTTSFIVRDLCVRNRKLIYASTLPKHAKFDWPALPPFIAVSEKLSLNRWIESLQWFTTSLLESKTTKSHASLSSEIGQEVMWSADVVQPSGSIPQGSCVLLSLLSGDPSLISADCNVSYWMYGYVCQYGKAPQLTYSIFKLRVTIVRSVLSVFFCLSFPLLYM